MKTAREKAEDFCNMKEFDSLPNKEGFVSSLTILLKEQDRDTRHASAEAVNTLPVSGYNLKAALINSDDAHAACMNVKAV